MTQPLKSRTIMGRLLAMLAVGCMLISPAPASALGPLASRLLAARAAQRAAASKQARGARGSISGTVVNKRKQAVAGARVHLAHHRRHHHHSLSSSGAMTRPAGTVASSGAKRAKFAQPAAALAARHAGRHHGIRSGSGGKFSIPTVRAGSHVLVAHKRHVGTGHARVTVTAGQTANVTIVLHKHHHHHAAPTGTTHSKRTSKTGTQTAN